MIDDLISRGNLIKAIYAYVEQHRNDEEISWTGYDWLLKEDAIIDIINSQPTAYDVDKVCRKINENKEIDNVIDADCAIKIVKSGGLNE